MDEIFRQSMMARAVRLRRGRGKPGTCTVFTKTIEDCKSLERVYFEPQLPLRFLSDNHISRLFLGMIGLGLMLNESDRNRLSDRLSLIFKKGSTTKVLNSLMKSDRIFVEKTPEGNLLLTSLGRATFHSGISAEQVRVILDGLSLIEAGGASPTEFDLLLLITSASVLERVQGKTTKNLDDKLGSYLKSSVKSVILPQILGSDSEKKWRIPIEYSSLILACMNEEISFESEVRKSTKRLLVEVQMFTPNFTSFLEELKNESAIGEESGRYAVIDAILSLLNKREICDTLYGSEKVSESLRGKDLSFINFGDIESSIDATLTSSLTPLQKIQLLDLLDTVEMTTSAFVDLLTSSHDDPEANVALETVLSFSKEGRMGSNLIRALEEEGLVERGTIDGLLNNFSKRVDEIQKRTDAPAKAAKVLLSLFSGDVVGLTTSGISALKIVLRRTRGKVDTSTL
jgi:hypothetical protein